MPTLPFQVGWLSGEWAPPPPEPTPQPSPAPPASLSRPTPFPPHLAVPFSISGGSAAVVQQDTLADVQQCVAMILGTQLGQRSAVPTFGVPDPTFADPDPAVVTAAVGTFEPRAAVTVAVTAGEPVAGLRVVVSLAQPA